MKPINFWETKFENEKCNYYYSLNEMIHNGVKITSFIVDDKLGENNNLYIDKIIENNGNDIIYTDIEHPILYNKIDGYIINREFYEKEKENLIKICQKNILDSNKNFLIIKSEIFDDEFFGKLMKLDNVKYCQFFGVEFSDEQKEMLKNKNIDAYLFNKNENIQLSSFFAIEKYTLNALRKEKSLTFNEIVSADKFKYLKEISNGSKIILKNANYRNIIAIINELEKLNKNIKIIIPLNNREDYPVVEFEKLKLNNVDIIFIEGIEIFPLSDFIEQENILNLMIKDIKTNDLSPLEKYMAVYEIVKKFKEFKRSKNDPFEARVLSKILFNDYIVCVGFSNLLVELLKRVGISSIEYSLGVDSSYDNGFIWENKLTKIEGHSRVIVNIEDKKYDINGFYMSDPTWDNALEKNLIIHSLMPFKMLQIQNRLTEVNKENIILDNNDFNDFSNKINFWLNREIEHIKKTLPFNESILLAYQNLYDIIMKIIIIDKEKYNYYKLKYDKEKMATENEYIEFLTEVGHYIISKTNNDINYSKLLLATAEVYKTVLGMSDKEVKKIMRKMTIENRSKYQRSFPYKVDLDSEHRLRKIDIDDIPIKNPYKKK